MSAHSEVMYTPRLCDNETIATKLIYRVRERQLSPSEMDGLQKRCRSELQELRQELNGLLNELRAALENREPSPNAYSGRVA